MSRPFTTLLPPPIEALATQYFAPLMAPVPVATRLPNPALNADTVEGFLRVEAAGGAVVSEQMFYDSAVLLHSYSPVEPQAESIIGKAVAWGANAQGTTITLDGVEWYVSYSRPTALPARTQDPLVALTRYRAMVSWRIPGQPIT